MWRLWGKGVTLDTPQVAGDKKGIMIRVELGPSPTFPLVTFALVTSPFLLPSPFEEDLEMKWVWSYLFDYYFWEHIFLLLLFIFKKCMEYFQNESIIDFVLSYIWEGGWRWWGLEFWMITWSGDSGKALNLASSYGNPVISHSHTKKPSESLYLKWHLATNSYYCLLLWWSSFMLSNSK